MRSLGVLFLVTLALIAGCDEFNGWPRSAALEAALGTLTRVDGNGDLAQPRFARGSGLFLGYTGGDAFGNDAVFRYTVPTLTSIDASEPEATDDLPDPIADDDRDTGTVSASGSLVAFLSDATNLLPDMPTLGLRHAFVRDLDTGTNQLVSHNEFGDEANDDTTGVALSANGRFVAFATTATNLSDRATTGISQIYLYDRQTSLLQLISHDADGFGGNAGSWNPALSSDGRFVAFESEASDLFDGDVADTRDIVVYDRTAGLMECVNPDTLGDCRDPSISDDGDRVAYRATDLGIMQVYLTFRAAATTRLLSKEGGGAAGDLHSLAPTISIDGRFVVFESIATNLVAGDTNGRSDVYVYDDATLSLARVSLAPNGDEPNDPSWSATISGDGSLIAFLSSADNLVDDDDNLDTDIFIAPNPLFP